MFNDFINFKFWHVYLSTNVKTAEPIEPKICVTTHMAPGMVYEWMHNRFTKKIVTESDAKRPDITVIQYLMVSRNFLSEHFFVMKNVSLSNIFFIFIIVYIV